MDRERNPADIGRETSIADTAFPGDDRAAHIIQQLETDGHLTNLADETHIVQKLADLRVQSLAHELGYTENAPNGAPEAYYTLGEKIFGFPSETDRHDRMQKITDAMDSLAEGDATLGATNTALSRETNNQFRSLAELMRNAHADEIVTKEAQITDLVHALRFGIDEAKQALGDKLASALTTNEDLSAYFFMAEQALFRTEALLKECKEQLTQREAERTAADAASADAARAAAIEEETNRELIQEFMRRGASFADINMVTDDRDKQIYGDNFRNQGQNEAYSLNWPNRTSRIRPPMPRPESRNTNDGGHYGKDPATKEAVIARILQPKVSVRTIEVAPATKGFLGIGEKPAVTRQEHVETRYTMRDFSATTSEPDADVMAISYNFTDRGYVDYTGRVNELAVGFYVPTELGERMVAQIKRDPTFIRKLVDRAVREQFGFREEGWGTERTATNYRETMSQKPNYQEVHEHLGGKETMLIQEDDGPALVLPVFQETR